MRKILKRVLSNKNIFLLVLFLGLLSFGYILAATPPATTPPPAYVTGSNGKVTSALPTGCDCASGAARSKALSYSISNPINGGSQLTPPEAIMGKTDVQIAEINLQSVSGAASKVGINTTGLSLAGQGGTGLAAQVKDSVQKYIASNWTVPQNPEADNVGVATRIVAPTYQEYIATIGAINDAIGKADAATKAGDTAKADIYLQNAYIQTLHAESLQTLIQNTDSYSKAVQGYGVGIGVNDIDTKRYNLPTTGVNINDKSSGDNIGILGITLAPPTSQMQAGALFMSYQLLLASQGKTQITACDQGVIVSYQKAGFEVSPSVALKAAKTAEFIDPHTGKLMKVYESDGTTINDANFRYYMAETYNVTSASGLIPTAKAAMNDAVYGFYDNGASYYRQLSREADGSENTTMLLGYQNQMLKNRDMALGLPPLSSGTTVVVNGITYKYTGSDDGLQRKWQNYTPGSEGYQQEANLATIQAIESTRANLGNTNSRTVNNTAYNRDIVATYTLDNNGAWVVSGSREIWYKQSDNINYIQAQKNYDDPKSKDYRNLSILTSYNNPVVQVAINANSQQEAKDRKSRQAQDVVIDQKISIAATEMASITNQEKFAELINKYKNGVITKEALEAQLLTEFPGISVNDTRVQLTMVEADKWKAIGISTPTSTPTTPYNSTNASKYAVDTETGKVYDVTNPSRPLLVTGMPTTAPVPTATTTIPTVTSASSLDSFIDIGPIHINNTHIVNTSGNDAAVQSFIEIGSVSWGPNSAGGFSGGFFPTVPDITVTGPDPGLANVINNTINPIIDGFNIGNNIVPGPGGIIGGSIGAVVGVVSGIFTGIGNFFSDGDSSSTPSYTPSGGESFTPSGAGADNYFQ